MSKFESMWRIMCANNYEIDGEIENELKCTMCKKLMIKACNTPCGCRYCSECISDYLGEKSLLCPGRQPECTDGVINFKNDLLVDHPINNKIAKLIVKCPKKSCNFKTELRNIEDHIRICIERPANCPFANVGCQKEDITADQIGSHLAADNQSHVNMLMECIDHLRNEIESLNKATTDLKEERIILNNKIYNLELKQEAQRTDMLEYQRKTDQYLVDMHQMKSQLQQIEEKTKTMGQQTRENIKCEYVWKIENISGKRQQAQMDINKELYSEPFYSHTNGYKFCLRTDPNGNGRGKSVCLSVFFCVMRGALDDILPWPFTYNVTLALINQRTLANHTSETIKSSNYSNPMEYQKPTTERNNGFGYTEFIKLDELFQNTDLCQNDQIFIKCTVNSDLGNV